MDKLVVGQYGADAGAEDVKDAIKILLGERKSSRPMSKRDDAAWISAWKSQEENKGKTDKAAQVALAFHKNPKK